MTKKDRLLMERMVKRIDQIQAFKIVDQLSDKYPNETSHIMWRLSQINVILDDLQKRLRGHPSRELKKATLIELNKLINKI